MPTRSLVSINQLVLRSKANMFSKMMLFAEALEEGVAQSPDISWQDTLTFACESDYSTLEEKNIFANMIAGIQGDVVKPDGYVQVGYWQNGYAQ
jgi:hypothetical protein